MDRVELRQQAKPRDAPLFREPVEVAGDTGERCELPRPLQRLLRAARPQQELEPDRSLVREAAEQLHLGQREPDVVGTIEDREDAQRLVLVEQRHGHQALRDVAGGLCGLPPEPRVALDVLHDEGLARREHPAGDSRSRGKRRPTSSSEPWPATASKTSSPAASSSRKIEDALAEKIARAVSTIDWRRERCSPSPVRTPAATAARNRSSLTSRRPRCSR